MDLVSKFDKYDYDKIIQQHQRLWDLSPLLNHHPKYIPGIYFDLCLPSKDEQEFLQSFVCETGEADRVLTEINNQASNKSKPNVSILSMAARQYLESREHENVLIGDGGFNCTGDHPAPQCERDLENYLRETSAPELGEDGAEGTPPGDGSPPEGQQQADERSAANQGVQPEREMTQPEREMAQSEAPGTGASAAAPPAHDFLVVSTPATSSRAPSPTPTTSLTSSPTTSLSETVSLCEVTPSPQPEVTTSVSSPARLVDPEWQARVNELILRRTCFGFGPRGALAILTKTLQLLLDWKKAAGLCPADRLQRQRERRQLQQDCQTDQERQVRSLRSKSLLCRDFSVLHTC